MLPQTAYINAQLNSALWADDQERHKPDIVLLSIDEDLLLPPWSSEREGVLVTPLPAIGANSQTVSAAPADTAGLRSEDIIIELAGRKIENIHDYVYAIDALKIGEEVGVVVERDGKVLRLRITPGSRE